MQGARDEGEGGGGGDAPPPPGGGGGGGGGGIAPSPSFQPLFALTSLFIFSIAL